jgi:hypothetical protein
MELQYMLSNGEWTDCGDRTDSFLDLCVRFGGLADREATIAALNSGKTVRNDSEDWYSKCRAKPAARPAQPEPKWIYCKKCGERGLDGQHPFSTLRGSGICDDCV